ncbi:esterase-like activity of phytase family protein [Pseudomonas sp. dw_358]|uniref:esterase-like activity of phytase family protein n=1 Tax=Pseudomonas sp. dw_358 TaxID=2720083 RepID=UPI001BD6AE30|nr:esterase-like activity of phytase family protein [Pseudomonas sp. dw_358]
MAKAPAAWLSIALMCIAAPCLAAPVEQLKLLSEHVVDGMRGGNLSGLAACGDGLWTVSDRDDDVIYRFDPSSSPVWQAHALAIKVPAPPPSGLSEGVRLMVKASTYVRGGSLDFEGISCDAQGNRYVVSEAYASVLKVPRGGAPQWLPIDPAVVGEARERGLLAHFNAIFEGIAVDPGGKRMWLAAEREQRGLLVIKRRDGDQGWGCEGHCVLLSEAGYVALPTQITSRQPRVKDFSDLSLYKGKLYTLERNAYQICRRDPVTATVEHCWSFANEVLAPGRRYDQPYGLLEALVIDEQGAWLGVDNNDKPREDGEVRPIVWRFAAPQSGWEAP